MKRLMRGILVGSVLTTSLAAGDISPKYFDPNDYPLLFAREETRAETAGPGIRSVSLGNGIEVRQTSRNGSFGYTSVDHSEAGPVLCVVAIWTIFAQQAVVCPDAFGGGAIAQIDRDLDRLSEFVGENAFPPTDPKDYREYLDAVIAAGAAALKTCDQPNGMMHGIESFVAALTDDAIDRVLATPRLPVLHPCLEP